MTLQEFELELKGICSDTYRKAAPRGITRFISWHEYNKATIRGDDRTVFSAPRIQLDVYWQQRGDLLAEAVTMLLDTFGLPYSVEDTFFDDTMQLNRCIIQAVVL